jgi:hypothetical protein
VVAQYGLVSVQFPKFGWTYYVCTFVIVASYLQVNWNVIELKGAVDSLKVWFCIGMTCVLGNEGKNRNCVFCGTWSWF